MHGLGKNDKQSKRTVARSKKTPKVEPLRTEAGLSNGLAKFPFENPYPVLRVSKDGKVLYANKASIGLLEDRDSGPGKPAPADWQKAVEKALETQSVITIEIEHRDKVFAIRIVPIAEAGYCNFYGEDITEQKTSEEEREMTIKLFHLLNSDNQKHELMKLVTEFLRDWSGCEAVGIRLKEGEDYPYFVTSGFPEEFVCAENKLCSVNEIGELIRDSQGRPFLECMCGNIISSRFDPSKSFFTEHGSFWTNSTTELLTGTTERDRLAKTRNRCNTAGYESVALVPLKTAKETFGLLQFNSKQKDLFTPDKISFFERLADNLSIGLTQRKTEDSLRTSEGQLSIATNIAKLGYWEYDVAKDLFTFNDQFYKIFRTTADKVGGYKMSSARYAELFLHPDDKEIIAAETKKALEITDPNYCGQLEHRIIYADGEIGHIAVRYSVVKDSRGRTIKTYGAKQDITERKYIEETLRKQRDFAKSLLDTAQAIILVLDTQGRIVDFNPYMEEISGYSFEEVGGLDWFDIFIPKNNCEHIRELFSGAIQGIQTRGNVNPIVTKSGELRQIEWYDKTLKNAAGNVGGLLLIGLDITERIRGNLALRESEERLKAVMDAAELGIWDWDLVTGQIIWSGHHTKLLGYKQGEFDGSYETFAKRVHPEDLPGLNAALEKSQKNNTEYLYEYRVIWPDGTVRWILGKGRCQCDNTGRPIRMLGTFHDITESRLTHEALRESEERFRKALENIPDVVVIYDTDLRIRYINAATHQITGLPMSYFIGKRDDEIWPPEVCQAYLPTLRKAFDTRKICSLETDLFLPDTGLFNLSITFVPILDENGNIREVVGITQNFTERKISEKQLLEYQKQLKNLASRLALTEELERRRIAGEFHDQVTQSLALAKIKLDELYASETSPALLDKLRHTRSSLEKAIQDTRSLTFDLSYPILYELGFEAAVAEWLNEHIRDKHGINTEFQNDNREKPINDDVRIMLFRNVRELLINAIKHTRAETVKVHIRRIDDSIEVTVEDNGVGFDPIKEEATAAKKSKFGLFSIRESLEVLGGSFKIESKPGAGCKAIMTAPLRKQTSNKEE